MSAKTWQKLPALDGRPNPCGCCPPIRAQLAMECVIAVGFGDAHVERDGEEVYREASHVGSAQECDRCDGTGACEGGETYLLTTCEKCGGFGYIGELPPEWMVADAERAAVADPDHDWRIVLYGPLHGEVYQRHGLSEWMLVEKNEGFA